MNKTIGKIKEMTINSIPTFITIIFLIFLIELSNRIYFWIALLIIVLFFVYRIYYNPEDILYIAREQLEMTLFGKPFRFREKGEKLKMAKFVWRKSK